MLAQDRDRFAREPAYHYLLRREFDEHGTKIRALNDRGDESPEGELTDGILDQLGKYERAKIAKRTRRGSYRRRGRERWWRGVGQTSASSTTPTVTTTSWTRYRWGSSGAFSARSAASGRSCRRRARHPDIFSFPSDP